MPAHRLDDGDLPIGEQLAQVAHLPHAGAHVVILHALGDADGKGFHIAPRHAAVGVQSFVDHHQVAQVVEQLGIAHRQPAADVDQVILLGAHPGPVGVAAELLEDLGDRLALVTRLPLLDEKGVFVHAGGVQVDAHAVAVAELA